MAGLHYADFLSLHYVVYESISCNHDTKLNYCQLPFYIHHRATYLSLPPYLSYYNWPLFFLYSSSNLLLPTQISILLSYRTDFPHSLLSSHLHTVIPEANLLIALEIISITITNSRGLNTDPWCNPTFTLNALLSPSVVLTTVCILVHCRHCKGLWVHKMLVWCVFKS